MADEILERWAAVVGYEGLYSVSDMGRVRSEDRTVIGADGSLRRMKGRLLKQSLGKDGYWLTVTSNKSVRKCHRTHILVLTAFTGSRPLDRICCHNNGNQTDNRLTNLRWDSQAGNEADKVLHGTLRRGETHPNSRLTESDIRRIREDQRDQKSIARDYSITQSAVCNIRSRRAWTHVS